MKNSLLVCRIVITALCLTLFVPVTAFAANDTHEVLISKLHEFGKTVAESYNRCVKGNKQNKDVTKNADGSYTAVYNEIDPQSISCSYKDSSNPKGPVKYIGTLNYSEVRYSCTAKSKAEALKGPFTAQRTNTTELVKYVKNKWTY